MGMESQSSTLLARWTRWVLAHRRLVAACWVALAVVGGATSTLTTSRLGKSFTLPGRPSYLTDGRIVSEYGSGGGADPVIPVIVAPPGQDLEDPAARAELSSIEAAASVGHRYRVVGYAGTGDPRFLTVDRRATYLLVFTPPTGFEAPDPTPAITAAVRRVLPAGWSDQTTGTSALQATTATSNGHGVLFEAVLGGLGALVVLAVVFGSPLAVLPLVMAMAAIPTTFLLLLGLTALTVMNFVVQFLIGLVGLGVAIDYSLLVTTRWREEASRRSREDAVVAAMTTAGRSVVFAGTTVAIGMIALVILPVPFLHSMGYAGVLIPLVSVAVALSLLPVCLASFGTRLDRHRFRRADSTSQPWRAWAGLVTRYKVAAATAGIVILAAVIAPVFSLRVGQQASGSFATSGVARAALTRLERGGVPSGVLDPMEVLTKAPEAAKVTAALTHIPGVYLASGPTNEADRRNGTALVTVIPAAETGAPAGPATIASVRRGTATMPGVLGVGGTGPETIDLDNAIYGGFPLVLLVVTLLTLVVLIRAFRSVLLAVKAVLLNLASLGAAYGVLVFVWQQGHGSKPVFGLPATGAIPNWIPIVVFAFLFGLAIDYEVFILTRMREAWDATGRTEAAVIEGLSRTGRLVTSAALILTFAFVSMSTAPIGFLKILATGLAAGILVDAFVVRSLLVPALVALFGRWNWVLPEWLERPLLIRPARPALVGSPYTGASGPGPNT